MRARRRPSQKAVAALRSIRAHADQLEAFIRDGRDEVKSRARVARPKARLQVPTSVVNSGQFSACRIAA